LHYPAVAFYLLSPYLLHNLSDVKVVSTRLRAGPRESPEGNDLVSP